MARKVSDQKSKILIGALLVLAAIVFIAVSQDDGIFKSSVTTNPYRPVVAPSPTPTSSSTPVPQAAKICNCNCRIPGVWPFSDTVFPYQQSVPSTYSCSALNGFSCGAGGAGGIAESCV